MRAKAKMNSSTSVMIAVKSRGKMDRKIHAGLDCWRLLFKKNSILQVALNWFIHFTLKEAKLWEENFQEVSKHIAS